MAITKTTILTQVRIDTGRKENLVAADIETHLLGVLIDISGRHPFLKADDSGTLGADAKATKPADFRHPGDLFITADDETIGEVSLDEYLNETMAGYVIRGNEILVGPKALYAGKAYVFYYGKKHGSTIETIEFGDDFFDAITNGVSAKVFKQYSMFAEAREFTAYYENEIEKLTDGESMPPAVTQMRTWVRM